MGSERKDGYGMGDVDIADQLRVFYRMDHWLRNVKWWWSILFWALGVILTNSFIIYKKICEEEGIEPKYNHYEFLKEVGMYWLNPQLMEKETVALNYSNRGFTSPTSTISSITMDSLASTRT